MSTPNPQPSQRIENSSIQDSKVQQGQAGKNLTQIQADHLTQVYVSLFGGDRSYENEKLSLELEERLLKNYIQPELKQRLRDTIQQNCWLNPELEEQSHQVGGLAPNCVVKVSDKPEEHLGIRTTILEVFCRQDICGKLLILGEPGAGKTTALLALADQLAQQALANPGTAIPVIFELSTWQDNQQSIQEWLKQQLQEIYPQITSAIAERWLEAELLLPLLDGLDELGERQSICIQQLNQFVEKYPGLKLVVCCRTEEYTTGVIKLEHRRGAVHLQPLTSHQIHNYLQQVGQPELWSMIETESEMQILVSPDSNSKPGILQIPLFLKIAAESYCGKPFSNKVDLLDAYVERRLSRDIRGWERKNSKDRGWAYWRITEEPSYTETRDHLSWLAQKLKEYHRIEFSIESMQPWLMSEKQIKSYLLSGGLLSVGIAEFAYLLMFSSILKELISSLFGSVNKISMITASSFLSWFVEEKIFGLFVFLLILVTLGLIIALVALREVHEPIVPSTKSLLSLEILKSSALQSEFVPPIVCFSVLSGGIMGTIVGASNGQLVKSLLLGLLSGVYVFGFVLIFFGLIVNVNSDSFWNFYISNHPGSTLSADTPYQTIDRKSNQGILNACINTLIIVLFATIYIGLGGAVMITTLGYGRFSLLPGLGLGLFFGFLFGGGIQCLKHLILRLLLNHSGCIPWNYVRFLNYCVERRLLQRIGGRYRFLHRELLEHFAQKAGGV